MPAKPTKPRPPRPCVRWALVEPTGTIATQHGIYGNRRWLINDAPSLVEPDAWTFPTWRELYRRGYRVVRVRIVPMETQS